MGGRPVSRSPSPPSRGARSSRRRAPCSTPPRRRWPRPARSSRAATRSATSRRSTASRRSGSSTRRGSGARTARRPGDALFLTKALGTGLVLTGVREGVVGPAEYDAATGSMASSSGRRRGAAAVRAERGHRRDGLRALRARLRGGRSKRRADRPRGGSPAAAPRRAGRRRGAGCAPAATGATATSPAPPWSWTASREDARARRLRPADLGRAARLAAGRPGGRARGDVLLGGALPRPHRPRGSRPGRLVT